MDVTCDETRDMLFLVLGFCCVVGQKFQKRKFEPGGEIVVFLVRNVRKESSRLVGRPTVTTICCFWS